MKTPKAKMQKRKEKVGNKRFSYSKLGKISYL
jgi:hypothetical protein